ncbi:hypothetical protein [Bacillus pumilus]|uniref:hypothetical protein n=1 Tax=Bacillus pumilus TaxID=1408 RepID=UPI0011A25C30|nr:hypothetical protein [Bacillus pumilus]
MAKESISFTYDPLNLSRKIIQIHAENKYDGNKSYSESVRFALFEFLRTMEDEEFKKIMTDYVLESKVKAIHFKGDENGGLTEDKDCVGIVDHLMSTERFKDLVFKNKRNGCSGLGVIVLKKKLFYQCEFGEHWSKVGKVLRENYPSYADAYDEMILDSDLKNYNDISREELDNFILENFDFVGGRNKIEYYLNN